MTNIWQHENFDHKSLHNGCDVQACTRCIGIAGGMSTARGMGAPGLQMTAWPI